MSNLKYDIYFDYTSKRFLDRGFEAILAVHLTLAIVFLLQLFPIMGIALGLFAYCFLCIGTKRYLISIAREEFLPIESIFSTFKISIKAFCLKFAYMLITSLWLVIFIVPGIICAINYGFSSFVLADDFKKPVLECMEQSKKLVYGHRAEIFIVYLAYAFVTLASMCIFATFGIVIKAYTNIGLWFPIVSMIISFLFVFLVLIVPYFELMFANIYLSLKNEKEPKTKTSQKSSVTKNNGGSTRSKKVEEGQAL